MCLINLDTWVVQRVTVTKSFYAIHANFRCNSVRRVDSVLANYEILDGVYDAALQHNYRDLLSSAEAHDPAMI